MIECLSADAQHAKHVEINLWVAFAQKVIALNSPKQISWQPCLI